MVEGGVSFCSCVVFDRFFGCSEELFEVRLRVYNTQQFHNGNLLQLCSKSVGI